MVTAPHRFPYPPDHGSSEDGGFSIGNESEDMAHGARTLAGQAMSRKVSCWQK
jgi:hypothetical protein